MILILKKAISAVILRRLREHPLLKRVRKARRMPFVKKRCSSEAETKEGYYTKIENSICTTVAVTVVIGDGKAKCALCSKIIAVHKKSSTNIISHYRKAHGSVVDNLNSADSLNATSLAYIVQ